MQFHIKGTFTSLIPLSGRQVRWNVVRRDFWRCLNVLLLNMTRKLDVTWWICGNCLRLLSVLFDCQFILQCSDIVALGVRVFLCCFLTFSPMNGSTQESFENICGGTNCLRTCAYFLIHFVSYVTGCTEYRTACFYSTCNSSCGCEWIYFCRNDQRIGSTLLVQNCFLFLFCHTAEIRVAILKVTSGRFWTLRVPRTKQEDKIKKTMLNVEFVASKTIFCRKQKQLSVASELSLSFHFLSLGISFLLFARVVGWWISVSSSSSHTTDIDSFWWMVTTLLASFVSWSQSSGTSSWEGDCNFRQI